MVAVTVFFVVSAVAAMGSADAAALPRATVKFSSVQAFVRSLFADTAGKSRQAGGTAAGRGGAVTAASTRSGKGTGHAPGTGKGELPAYSPPARKTAAGASGSAYTGFDAKTSKRDARKSLRFSDYFQNADGSYTVKTSVAPLNYQASDGSWQPIDAALVRGTDGRLHQRADGIGVSFAGGAAVGGASTRLSTRVLPDGSVAAAPSSSADASSGSDGELVSVSLGSGESMAWSLQGAAAVTPTVSGATAQYDGILPDTDLVLTSNGAGVKESLVLSSSAAPNSWTFPLQLSGVSLVDDPASGWELVDDSGAVVGWLPQPFAYDGVIDASGSRDTSYGVSYALTTSGSGQQSLVMTLDPSWLRDPARVFPVTVDPTVTVGDAGKALSTYVMTKLDGSCCSNADFSSEGDLKVGFEDFTSPSVKARSFIYFDTMPVASGYHVSQANVGIFDIWASTCSAAPFDVYPITGTWSAGGGKTWVGSTYTGPSYGPSMGEVSTAPGAACTNTGGSTSTGTWMYPQLNTSVVNQWTATNSSSYWGIALAAPSESNDTEWKIFDSTLISSNAPYVFLTYTPNTAPQVNTTSPVSGYNSATLTPTLSATGSDPDNWPGTGLHYEFQVFDGANNKNIADSKTTCGGGTGTGTSPSFTVPAGTLTWGQSYWWAVSVCDGDAWSPWTSSSLQTAVPPPLLTSGLSQDSSGRGYDPQLGNYTTSATDAQVASVGPALSITRDYNSLDPRTSQALGAGWSSILDAKASEQYDASANVTSVTVTYPDGSEVGYGKNADGTFAAPLGRFARFATASGGGYTLTDKNDTVYTFAQSLGSGVYGLSSVADAAGRTLTVGWTSGQIMTLTSASGRALHVTWATPSGASFAHVAAISTDPVSGTDQSTDLVWKYFYTGDQLASVCDPVQSGSCTGAATDKSTKYTYTPGSQYRTAVLDAGPSEYWPLSETSYGTNGTAADQVLANEHSKDATYTSSGVTFGVAGPLKGSGSSGVTLDGSSGAVTLPQGLLVGNTYLSVSLWFKTATTSSSGPLLCEQNAALGATPGNATCSLYVGTDGKLRGQWYNGAMAPMVSTVAVNDAQWHHVVLSGSGNSQQMYLDGSTSHVAGGPLAGQINNLSQNFDFVGAGYNSAQWPGTSATAGTWYFPGSVSDVSFYTGALSAAGVSALNAVGNTQASLLTKVTRPTGAVASQALYSAVTGRVIQVTDANGGVWLVGAPSVSGSAEGYRAAVMASAPSGYWRLGDAAQSTVAYDEVASDSGAMTYSSNVTLGAAGPLNASQSTATLNGTSAYLTAPASLPVGSSALSVSLWFDATGANGVLFSHSATALPATSTSANYQPMLYIGNDGKLVAGIGTSGVIQSSAALDDSKWHQAVLTVAGNVTNLYIDGKLAGSGTATPDATAEPNIYIGSGYVGGGWPNEPHNGATAVPEYFTGSLAEAAFFPSTLSGADVSALYAAAKNASTGLNPTVTVAVTDPNTKQVTYEYDPVNGGRMIARVDAAGAKTTYGYDTGGFLHTVADPDGNETITGHDGRGNRVSETTCQVQATNDCSTQYYSYYPAGNGTAVLASADARNDMMLSSSDGRSSGSGDKTYQTTYGYDALGDRTSVTTPPVPGYPTGRTASTTYSDGTSAYPAADGGNVPAGLPVEAVSAGGAVTLTSYLHSGDVAATRGPDGFVTRYKYDGVGRVLSKTTSPTGPAAWWPLNQTSGTTVPDATVDGNTGTANAVTWSGGVGVFNGSSSQITTATPVLNTAASFTLSAWVNLSQVPSSYADVLTLGGNFQYAAYLLYSPGNGSWSFVTTSGDTQANAYYSVGATTAPTAGAWTHLVGVYDQAAGVDKLYVNNVLIGTAAAPHAWSATHILSLGSGGGSAYFPGSIANVQLYQRALSASDVNTLYGAGYAGSTVSAPSPNGQVTTLGYDGLGRTVTSTAPATTDAVTGAVHTARTTTTFDADGDATQTTVADLTGGDTSRTTTMAYNSLDQLQSTTDAANATTTYTYNALGLKATVKNAAGDTTSYTYDPDGRLTYTTLKNYTGSPSGSKSAADLIEEARAYDPAGRLASVTDAMSYSTLYTYTDNGLTATVTRCSVMNLTNGAPTCTGGSFVQQSNSYDAAGNQVKQVTNNGTTETDYTYDAAGRQTTTTLDPAGLNRTTRKTFTADDFIASQTTGDPSGSATTDYSYTPTGVMSSQSVENYTTGAPTGWWKLNDGASGATTPSTARDWSGQNNTATLGSGVNWASQAASLGGTGAITASGPAVNTAGSFSVSAWAFLNTISGGFQDIVSQDATKNSGFNLEYDPTDAAWSFTRASSDTSSTTAIRAHGATAPATGTWYHLVGVYDATTGAQTLYVNGAAVGTATDTTPYNATGPLVIGRGQSGGNPSAYLNGKVANVQTYPRALSASDASTLYGAGRLGSALSSSTNTTNWQVDNQGLAVAMTDADGNTTHYMHDAAGQRVQTIDPTVAAGTYSTATGTYTSANMVPVSSTGYDTFGEVAETMDPDGNMTLYTYDADGRQVAATAPSYTQPGSVNNATIAAAKTRSHYNTLGQVDQSFDAAGTETDYSYDQLGNQTSATLDPSGLNRTSTAQYDTDGDLTQSTDPTGAIQRFDYDYLGREQDNTQVLGVGGSGSTQTPAGCATDAAITGAVDCKTTNQYTDTAGFLSQTTSPAGAVTTFAYDTAGERTRVTVDATNTTSTAYDFAGRPVKTTLPDSSYATTVYNAAGQQTTESQYSSTGTLVATSSAAYDGDGNVLSTTDPDANALIAQGGTGYSTTYTYDATGLLASETQPVTSSSAITTSFGYDAAGNQTKYVTGNHNTWYTTYNSWNLPEAQVEPPTVAHGSPGDSTSTIVYDTDGRAVEQDAPGGVITQQGYDTVGEVLTQSSPSTGADLAATATRTFTYYNNGLVKTASTANTATGGSNATSEAFAYDDSGNLATATGSAGSSAFTYGADGQMASRTDTVAGTAHTTSYGYDSNRRLSTINDALTGTTLTYSYNSLDLVSQIAYGSGGDTRTLSYSNAHLLSGDSLATAANPNTPFASISYGYDSDGNETSKTTTGFTGAAANTYSYDYAGRLTSWNNGSSATAYSYDADGNRTQVGANVFTYDARDQLTSDGVTSYTYTARGTQQTATNTTTGTLTTSTDAFGQVQSDAADSYTYDALGRVTTSGATAFDYSGQGNTLSYDGNAVYSRDPAGNLIADSEPGKPARIDWTDQHNDVVGYFSSTDTALDGSTAYDPLGKVLSKTGHSTALGYQSEYTSPNTAKIDMAARWYNPTTGQFTSKDTQTNNAVPNPANANSFAYANDNPLTGTDPTGHCRYADDDFCMDTGASAADQASAGNTTVLTHNATPAVWNTYKHYVQNVVKTLKAAKANYDYWFTPVRNELLYPDIIDDGDCRQADKCGQSTRAADSYNDAANAALDAQYQGSINNQLLSMLAGGAAGTVCGAISLGWLAAVCAGAVGGAVSSGTQKALDCSDGYDTACSLGDYAKTTLVGAGWGAGFALLGFAAGKLGGALFSKLLGAADPEAAIEIAAAATNTVDSTVDSEIASLNKQADNLGTDPPPTPNDTPAAGGNTPTSSATGKNATSAKTADTAAASPGTKAATSDVRATSPSKVEPTQPKPDTTETETTPAGCPTQYEPHSFTGSTQVLMADGTTTPIDQIKAGDHIGNAVPGQSSTQDNTVTNVIITTTDHDFVALDIKPLVSKTSLAPASKTGTTAKSLLNKAAVGLTAAVIALGAATATSTDQSIAAATTTTEQGGTLTTTFHHPFYDITQAAFVDAQNLEPGDELQTPTGYAVIDTIHRYHANTVTYDLTIGNLHTYYVVAGDTPVLVHNDDGASCGPTGGNIVYRNLRPDEDPANGLTAKNPDATYTPAGHVLNGSRPGWASQFISTTRDPGVALFSQWSTGRVVAINLDLFPGGVFDLSTDAGRAENGIRGFTAINRAKSSGEVLLQGYVPPGAITWVQGGPLDDAAGAIE